LHLGGVDPAGRVTVALTQGVTNHPKGGVAPQRPLGGRGLGGVAALLGKAPHAAGGQRRQLGVRRVVPDRLPVGQLRVAGGHHPPVRDLADQLGRGRAQQAAAVRAARRELHRQVALPGVPALLHPHPGPGVSRR
jgi:hypothetical protein